MAISKILHMKQAKSGYMAKHLANGLKYIMDPDKTCDGRYISGSNCVPENALQQMLDTKQHFGKLDKRQGYHLIISFEEEEISEKTAFEVVGKFVKKYLGPDFEAVYAIHNDTDHIHGHIIFNSVRCTTGYKYDYKNGEWDRNIQPLVNRLCKEHGLATLDMDAIQEKRRRRRAGIKDEPISREKKLSDRDARIKQDVDAAVRDADTYEEFIENLHLMGYETHGRKHLAVKETGAERARRLDRLGDEYTEEMLRCRIEQPPLPCAVTDSTRKAELIYVFVPYRSRHLTRYQKDCFVRKYRAGKVTSDTKTWKYRANLQAIKKLQEEYLFLVNHEVRSKKQIEEIAERRETELRLLYAEKQKRDKEMKPYQAILHLLDDIEEAGIEAGLYMEGYPEYRQEYLHYKQLVDQLSGLGYRMTDAAKIRDYFESEVQKTDSRRKELLKEKRIALRLKDYVQLQQRKTFLNEIPYGKHHDSGKALK